MSNDEVTLHIYILKCTLVDKFIVKNNRSKLLCKITNILTFNWDRQKQFCNIAIVILLDFTFKNTKILF